MKTKLKKSAAIVLSTLSLFIILCFSMSVSAALLDDAVWNYMQENDCYLHFDFKSDNILLDGEKIYISKIYDVETSYSSGDIAKFREHASEYTYLIDEKTIISSNSNIDNFISGKHPWLDIIILESEITEGNTIHISAVAGTIKEKVIYTSESIEKEKALVTLEEYGIIDKGMLNNENFITRAEFVSLMCKTLKLNEEYSSVTRFSDVYCDNPYIGHINSALNAGIIKGYGNSLFLPDSLITYNEAVKIIVSAIGYSSSAINQGGYPTGYIVVGEQMEIIKNTAFSPTGNVSFIDACIMIYNSLDLPIMKNDGSKFIVMNGIDGNEYISLRNKFISEEK